MQLRINKVLVITKYRFIGDTLNAIPTIRAAKERWPDAHLSILTGARACELLQNSPYVDQFIEFDPYRSADKGLKSYLSLINRLRREHFDLSLVLNRSFHSALTAALGGARKRYGWSGFEGRDFLLSGTCEYDTQKPEIECFLDVYRTAAQREAKTKDLELWLTNEEKQEAATLISQGHPLIGFQPGATHSYKQWPLEYFVDLAEKIVNHEPASRIVLIGGGEERPIADEFLRLSSDSVSERTINVVGELSLRMTLGIVARLDLFIGNDTAIRHAAIALRTPSISIFGPTSATKWGNANPPLHHVISSATGAMDGVAVDDIFELIDKKTNNVTTAGTIRASVNNLCVPTVGVEL